MFIAASLLLAAAVGCANVPEEQALEEYNTRTTALVEDFNSQVAALQADSTLSAEEMSAKMQEAYDAVSAELVSDGLEMIRKYPSGTLAVTVLQNTANVMEESQLAEALGMLEGAALEDEYVKSLVALNDAKRRAGVIAKNFELTDDACQVISLTIGDTPSAPIRYYAAPRVANDAVMMKSAVPAPAVSAGESTLTMRVGMEVRILPKK